MLWLFDIDGTLIKSFMRENGRTWEFDTKCPISGDLMQTRMDGEWWCPVCGWHGTEDAAVYDRVEVLPRRLAKLEALADDADARFGLVTNQGGVAFGYQTEQQVKAKLGRVVAAMDFFHGRPFTVQFAMTHPKATVERWRSDNGYRKPGPVMLLQAMEVHGVTTDDTRMVGDMTSDFDAAEAAGVLYYDAEEFFR